MAAASAAVRSAARHRETSERDLRSGSPAGPLPRVLVKRCGEGQKDRLGGKKDGKEGEK